MGLLGFATMLTAAALTAPSGAPVAARDPGTTIAPVRTQDFSMVALTWRGSSTPDAEVRVRDSDGWGAWTRLEELTDGPDTTSPEGSPVRGTELRWVGPSSAAQLRTHGPQPPALELVLVDPGSRAADRAAGAPSTDRGAARRRDHAPRPATLGRRDWGADGSLRNGSARYTGRIKQVHLHHTATGNDYSEADVPAIIRGLYAYHTRTLGWFDLGYNFVVDRFGRTWVGRSGGAAKRVLGAHTLGFNHRSVGIAVLGDFETSPPSRAALKAVVHLAAWKLDRDGRKAVGWTRVTSKGSDLYPAGQSVSRPIVAGHRDTNETACPGARLYARLDAVRQRTQARIARFS
jgi:uncharacterized protein with LGFP repeats